MGGVLVRLDALASFLEVTATAPKPYVCLLLHDEVVGMMMLDQVRHPCLEGLDGMSFIASNVSFKQGKLVVGYQPSSYAFPSR
jgi:DNA mismatch repair protein MSH2